MLVTETKADGLRREYAAKATADEIGQKVDQKLEEVRPTAQINGFRKGKAPISVLKKLFGKSVLGEVMRDIVDETVRDHLDENGHRPTADPSIRIVNESFDEGDDLAIEFSYELLPDVPEVSFSSLSLERLTVAVEESAVDEAVGNLAKNAKNYVAKDGAAESEDQVVIDFVGRIDGEAFEGGAAEDFPLVLGSNQFIPGFEDQLIGAAAGAEKDVTVTFPEAYQAEALAGKEAVFSVTVKEVRAAAEAAVDDELAKKYGLDDLAALKEQIRERLAEEYRGASRATLKRKLLDKLDVTVDFELPPSMVDQEAKQIAHQLWQEANPGAQAQDRPEIEAQEEHVTLAKRRVKLGLLLSDIGSRNEIKVTEAEVNNAIMAQAQQYRGQERQFFEFARNNAQIRQQITAPLFEDKVVDYAIELADVTERTVSAEELQKMLEEAQLAETGGDAPAGDGASSDGSADEASAPEAAAKA
ncbi:MAG: trigger factor [Pseudomonadota bacterium]